MISSKRILLAIALTSPIPALPLPPPPPPRALPNLVVPNRIFDTQVFLSNVYAAGARQESDVRPVIYNKAYVSLRQSGGKPQGDFK